MKPQLILKSLADIPAHSLWFSAAVPARAARAARRVLAPAVRATRREVRAARRNSLAFTRDFHSRASAPFQVITPWSRGGLYE